MARKRLSVFVMSAVLSVTVVALGNGEADTLKQIAGYREWSRLTEKPIEVKSFAFAA